LEYELEDKTSTGSMFPLYISPPPSPLPNPLPYYNIPYYYKTASGTDCSINNTSRSRSRKSSNKHKGGKATSVQWNPIKGLKFCNSV